MGGGTIHLETGIRRVRSESREEVACGACLPSEAGSDALGERIQGGEVMFRDVLQGVT